MAANLKSKIAFVTLCNALITGIQNLSNAASVLANGVTYTKAQLIAPLKAYVGLPAETATARTAWSAAVEAEQKAEVAALAMVNQVIKPYLQSRFGKKSSALSNFGLTPAKSRQITAATKATAILKGQATRKARNTMGKKQKLAVTGAQVGSTVSVTSAAPAVSKPTTA